MTTKPPTREEVEALVKAQCLRAIGATATDIKCHRRMTWMPSGINYDVSWDGVVAWQRDEQPGTHAFTIRGPAGQPRCNIFWGHYGAVDFDERTP